MIKCESITKEYQLGNNVTSVLKDSTLYIPAGTISCLVGVSGSGKTTLLKIIGQMLSVTSGNVYIDNIRTNDLDDSERAKFRNEKIGYISQEDSLIPILTIKENIFLPQIIANKKTPDIRDLIRYFDIEECLNKYPNQVSGGQKQLAAIIRSLGMSPGILLADEPTSALDEKKTEKFLRLMKTMRDEKGTTILLATHDVRLLEYADSVIRIENGVVK